MSDSYSLFNELLVTSKEHVLCLDSMVGLSGRRDVTAVSGSGTVTNNGLQHVLATGTTTASIATLDTADEGLLQGTVGLTASINFRVGATPTGQLVALWGLMDATSGVGFGLDASSPFVFTRTSGVDTKVLQTNWNTDKLDGTGTSTLTVDFTKGFFYQISVLSNTVEFAVVLPTSAGVMTKIVAHRISVNSPPVIDQPSLPIRVQVLNGTTNTNLAAYVASRDITLYRNDNPVKRLTAFNPSATLGTTFSTICSVRRKTATNFAKVPTRICSVETSLGGAVLFRIVRGSDPVNAEWDSAPGFLDAETCLEFDTADTDPEDMTDVVYQWIAPIGYLSHLLPAGIDFAIDRPYTFQAKILGTGAVGASLNIKFEENW
jgi:hypothetical protein